MLEEKFSKKAGEGKEAVGVETGGGGGGAPVDSLANPSTMARSPPSRIPPFDVGPSARPFCL